MAAVEAGVGARTRVHSLLAERVWGDAGLRTLVEGELAVDVPPYQEARDQCRTTVLLDGPPVALMAEVVQPVAMVLYELATNAAKHGAISPLGGRVDVRWHVSGAQGSTRTLELGWIETGGPPVKGSPVRPGFGSHVIDATVRGQLGGTVDRRWEQSGLPVAGAIPLERMVLADGQGPIAGQVRV